MLFSRYGVLSLKFNLGEATGSVQTMISGFFERLPYPAIAVVVFVFFLLVGKGVRATVRAVTQRNHRHYIIWAWSWAD